MTPTPPTAIRINRYLSMCGIASRRKADDLIREGKVEVNGEIPTDPGFTIDPERDRVAVNGRQIVRTHDPLYLVLNKPKDAITTLKDERGRPTVMQHLNARRRVYPVGRLDRNTTGVLLFTDDGEFAHRLMHPRFHVPKTYLVSCSGTVTREHLRALAEGVPLPDGTTAPAEIGVVGGSKASRIVITIREGRNRQVRRMFEHLGYEVTKLDRVAYGPVTVDDLPRGASRPLTPQEIRMLRRMAGMDAEGEDLPLPVNPPAATPGARHPAAEHRRTSEPRREQRRTPGSSPGPAKRFPPRPSAVKPGAGERGESRSGPGRHRPSEYGRAHGSGQRREPAPEHRRSSGVPPRGAKWRPAPPGGRKQGTAGSGGRREPASEHRRTSGVPPRGAKWRSTPPGGRKPGPAGSGERREPASEHRRTSGVPPRGARWRPAPPGGRKPGPGGSGQRREPAPEHRRSSGVSPRGAKWRPAPPGGRKPGTNPSRPPWRRRG